MKCDMQITKVQGIKCWVTGTLKTADSKTLLASVDAQLVNSQPLLAASIQK